jgi:hypothetical protein
VEEHLVRHAESGCRIKVARVSVKQGRKIRGNPRVCDGAQRRLSRVRGQVVGTLARRLGAVTRFLR